MILWHKNNAQILHFGVIFLDQFDLVIMSFKNVSHTSNAIYSKVTAFRPTISITSPSSK